MSAAKIIKTLWDAADADRLTDEQLAALVLGDESGINLGNLGDIMGGIACLISNDTDAGNFQSRHDLPLLLFGFSSAIRAEAEAAYVSNQASAELRDRLEKKLKALNTRGRRS